ncbi:MAG: hypothetical protein Ta2D_03690 [Rickettsiales bacterium]|nr:MAG: hypothetical protein Ta2D_03690 [Rickettsiales bacterium]
MKKVFVLIFALLLSCKEDNRQIIRVGSTGDYPPYTYTKDNQMVGEDIELIAKILNNKGYRGLFEQYVYQDLFVALKKGEIDVIASYVPMDNSDKELIFSSPYSIDEFVLISNTQTFADNMNPSTIAVVNNAPAHFIAKDKFKDKKIITFRNFDELMKIFRLGDIDALIADKNMFLHYNENSLDNKKYFFSKRLSKNKIGFVVKGNSKNGKELIININAYLKEKRITIK